MKYFGIILLSSIALASAKRDPISVNYEPSFNQEPIEDFRTSYSDDDATGRKNAPHGVSNAENGSKIFVPDIFRIHSLMMRPFFPFRFPKRNFSVDKIPENVGGSDTYEGSSTAGTAQKESDIEDTFSNFFNIFRPNFNFGIRTPSFDPKFIKNLPPNYQNSTSDVHNVNGSKVMVNQTIHKQSGDDFNHFYHVKVIEVLPEGNVTETDYANVNPVLPEEKLPRVYDEEGDEPEKANDLEGPRTVDSIPQAEIRDNLILHTKQPRKNHVRRSAEVGYGNSGTPINFPPDSLNRFPQAFVNNKNIRPEDLKSLNGAIGGEGNPPKSRSYVYKNVGGKPVMYIVDHNAPAVGNNIDEVETVEVPDTFRPPDLSRDTLVNPDGKNSHQGLTVIDPNAEVFDLDLVLKEIDSRPQ